MRRGLKVQSKFGFSEIGGKVVLKELIYRNCEGDPDFQKKTTKLRHLNGDGLKVLHPFLWLQKLRLLKAD